MHIYFNFRCFKLALKAAFLLTILPLDITKAAEDDDLDNISDFIVQGGNHDDYRVDNEDEIPDVTYGLYLQPGDGGFQWYGDVPLSAVLVEDDDCRGSGLSRIEKFIELQKQQAFLRRPIDSNISVHTKKRLWRLRNMLGVLPRTDYKMDEFEKIAVDNIISTLDRFSRLLNPHLSIFSSFHISLCQDALTAQVYHLLRYRYEQAKKHLYLKDFVQKGAAYGFKDLKKVISGVVQMQQDPSLQMGIAMNLETLANKAWMRRLNVLVKDHFSSHSESLGSFLDERELTEFPDLSMNFPYEHILAELISEHSSALSQIYLRNRDEVRERLNDYGRRLKLCRQNGNISQMMIDILEPMEDIASLEFEDGTLVDQVPSIMGGFNIMDYAEALQTDGHKPHKFTTFYLLGRLHDLGKGMMDFFPKVYFQRDGGGPVSQTIRDALYQYIPFKLLRNIALNMHHANMLKRKDDVERIKQNMVAIRDLMRAIVPYVKEYIICELSYALDQPYIGAFQHKKNQEVKSELDQIVQAYPNLQELGDFAVNLGYMFISHMTIGNILRGLPPSPEPLTRWSRIQRDGFCRALSILGETAKNISSKVRDTIPDKEILKLLEIFRDEFSHYGGREKKLPLRFNVLFSNDDHTGLIYNALTDIQAIDQYFSDYCGSLWENKAFPASPRTQGHLKALMKTVFSLNYSPPAIEPLPHLTISENTELTPDLIPLRRTFASRDGRLERRLDHLRLAIQQVPLVVIEQIEGIDSFFPLGSNMGDHEIIRKIKELLKIQRTIDNCGEALLQHLNATQAQHPGREFQELKNHIDRKLQVPERLLPTANQIFQDKLNYKFKGYNSAFVNKQSLEQEIRVLVSNFSIEKEFEGLLSGFLTNPNIKKKYDSEQKRAGDVAAVVFLQDYIGRFGITDWEPWIQAFRRRYGLTPETEVKEELKRALVMAKGLVHAIGDLEPIVSELKSITTEFLHWEALEYNLPQLRDFMEEIDSSIQRIRSFNPGLLRSIERQLLKLRLMGNHIAHLNDAINFDKYNIPTRYRDINLILESIYGFTFNKTPIGQTCLLDALNIFIIDIERLLGSSDGALLHQQLPLPSYNTTGHWEAPNGSGGTFVFQERDIARDGDCGFHVLKHLTRKRGVQLLLKHMDNQEIRDAVVEDIRISFLAGQFVEDKSLSELKSEYYKVQTKVDMLRRQIVGLTLPTSSTQTDIETLKSLARHDFSNDQSFRAGLIMKLIQSLASLNTINAKIDAYTHDIRTYQNFINREFGKSNGWLSYIRNGKGCLYALAKIMGLDVRVWEPDPTQSGVLKPIPLANGLRGEVIHILHTDRLTHFNLLHVVK